jgi:hypothetical protein
VWNSPVSTLPHYCTLYFITTAVSYWCPYAHAIRIISTRCHMLPYNAVHLQYSCVQRHVPRLRAVSVDPSSSNTDCIMLKSEGYLELHEDNQVCCYSSDNLNERKGYDMPSTYTSMCVLEAYEMFIFLHKLVWSSLRYLVTEPTDISTHNICHFQNEILTEFPLQCYNIYL